MFYGSAATSCDNCKWVVLFVRFYETCNITGFALVLVIKL